MVALHLNPLPHAEGDKRAGEDDDNLGHLNPLPHAEGDTINLHSPEIVGYLNPLPHAEGDYDYYTRIIPIGVFKSTPSRRGRLCCVLCSLILCSI